MDQYQAFEAFLIVFFLMAGMVMLISIAMILDARWNTDPDATGYDKEAQEQHSKGVRL